MLATTVESTTLATVAYDAPRQLLWLEFRSHARYCYFGVPAAVHQGLLAAPSKGTYFNRNIRGRFPLPQRRRRPPLALRTRLGPETLALDPCLPLRKSEVPDVLPPDRRKSSPLTQNASARCPNSRAGAPLRRWSLDIFAVDKDVQWCFTWYSETPGRRAPARQAGCQPSYRGVVARISTATSSSPQVRMSKV